MSTLTALARALLSLWPMGCANPRLPKLPSLHLPEPAKHVSAERVGSHVRLSWTTSADTTDGETLRGPITAAVCRDDAPKTPPAAPVYPAPPDPCKVVHQVTVAPGESAIDDELPAKLLAGAPALVAYRVTLYNVHGGTAGAPAPVFAVAGEAPAAAGPLEFVLRRNGVLVKWQPSVQSPPAPVQLTRTLIATAAGPVAAPKERKHAGTSASAGSGKTPALVTLAAGDADVPGSGDPGGMIDRGIHDGDTVSYTAQRVRTVKLTVPGFATTGKGGQPRQTKASVESFEMRGAPSPAATFVFHDTLPPAAPVGVAAIPGGGFGEPPSIDLSWEPNAELDVTGYNIYRADAGSGKFTLLTAVPAAGPAYRDLSAKPGKRYEYRVTAIDQHRNESARSAAVAAELHSD